MSPQVNIALRCEVLYYTTTGIIQAVKDTQCLPPAATKHELYLPPQGSENQRGSLGVDEFLYNDQKSQVYFLIRIIYNQVQI